MIIRVGVAGCALGRALRPIVAGRGDCSTAASLALEIAAEVALHPSEGEAVALFADSHSAALERDREFAI